MRHILFEAAPSHSIAILVKGTAFKQQEIQTNYVDPLVSKGIAKADLIAFTLKYDEAGKAPAKFIKAYLDNLLPALASLGVKHLYVTDAAYFKVLTKEAKAEPHYGYVLPCKIEGFETMDVVLGLNYQQLIYNPDLQAKLDLSLETLASQKGGSYQALGSDIIHSAQYPETPESIQEALNSLHQYPSLTCDIETRSLRFNEAGIGSISFAWDEHNGIAFAVDYEELPEPENGVFGRRINNVEVKKLLKRFFTEYTGKIIWHNAGFDIKIIIYELWMKPI